MGNVSVVEKTATDISQNFMKMLMESVTECKASSDQSFTLIGEAAGDITVGEMDVKLQSMQQLDCMSSVDVSTLMKNFNKAEFETKTKQAVSGLPLGLNASVDSLTSTIVQNTVSESTIKNIQRQIATAKQEFYINQRAGGNITLNKINVEGLIQQAIKGVSDSIAKTIQQQTTQTSSKSQTDQLIDGFLSGSTLTKIVWIVVIGGGLIGVIALVLRLMLAKKESPGSLPGSYAQAYYPQDQVYNYQDYQSMPVGAQDQTYYGYQGYQ